MSDQLVKQAVFGIPWNHSWTATAALQELLACCKIEPALLGSAAVANLATLLQHWLNVLGVQLTSSLFGRESHAGGLSAGLLA